MNDRVSQLPVPLQVLIAAGRHALHGSTRTVPRLTNDETAALPAYARRHGMVAFLPHVPATFTDQSPDLCDGLQQVVRDHALAVLADTNELLAVARQLTQAGVEFAVLKGAVFSAWLYGDAGLRPFVDLDVLVREPARVDAARALERIGFVRRIPAGAADAIYASIGAWPLRRAGSLGVDLHWRLSARRFPMPLTADAVLSDAIPVRLGDHSVNAPAPTNAAVLALLHAAKHVWYALELILAIAWLARRRDVDWRDVHCLCRRAGA